MKQLRIVGTLPESSFVGGVSIHVQRLLKGLDAKGINYEFVDYKKIGVPKACLIILQHRGCVHIHVTNPILLLIFVVCCKLSVSKCIFTLHAGNGRFSGVKNLCLSLCLRMADVPVLVNQKSYKAYRHINSHARYIPAFLPPVSEPPLHEDVWKQLLACKQKCMPIVSTNASKSAIDKDGNDIYGIEFLAAYFMAHNNFTLLVSDPKGSYKKKLSPCADNIVFIDQPHSYFELLKNIDIFVRNTSTDGDALSVKEALYLGKPTLCSDVVDRPAGTILFKYCDEESLTKALAETREFDEGNNVLFNQCDVVEELAALYNSL